MNETQAFHEKDILQGSPQKQTGLLPINFSWIGLVRVVVPKVAWQRTNGPHHKKFPKLCSTHSRKPSLQQHTPHTGIFPRVSPIFSPEYYHASEEAPEPRSDPARDPFSQDGPKSVGGACLGTGPSAPSYPISLSILGGWGSSRSQGPLLVAAPAHGAPALARLGLSLAM